MTLLEFLDLNNIHCLLAIFISILNGIILVMLAYKFMQVLQLSGYKIKGYNLWLKDTKAKYISRIAMLCFLSLCCVLVINFLFDVYHSEAIYSYFGLVFYLIFSIVYIANVNNTPKKSPLVQTRRMSRFITTLFLISEVITFCLIWLATVYTPFLRFGIIVLTPLLLPILIPFVHLLLIPLEEFIRWIYIHRAKKRLEKFPNLIKIGITGSYGKTSVKYILNKILSEKYNVCMSPHSFNTPMGLTKVVLKYLKKDNEVLISEMGAKQVGDIAYLCDLIKPTYAILTGVGSQHYETFGSKENIAKTKNELILSLPENAVAVFNTDSEICNELYKQCKLKNKISISLLENSEVQAKKINLSTNGISFDLEYDKKSVKIESKLLGEHNVLNILLASAMAIKLGVSLEQISNAVKELEPINHRLEPIKSGNMTVLDDAYSSNEEGAKKAVDVLALYKDTIKICVTPGIVELGSEEKKINKEFGKYLAKVCDYVIIVNKVNEEALKEGLIEGKFSVNRIITAETLDNSKVKLKNMLNPKKKYTVLYNNDLPDNYT